MQIHQLSVFNNAEPISILYGQAPAQPTLPRRAFVALSARDNTAAQQQVQVLEYIARPESRAAQAPGGAGGASVGAEAPAAAAASSIRESSISVVESVQLMDLVETPRGEVLLVAGRKAASAGSDTPPPVLQFSLYNTTVTTGKDVSKLMANSTTLISTRIAGIEAFLDDRAALLWQPQLLDPQTHFLALPLRLQPSPAAESPLVDLGCDVIGFNGTLVWRLQIGERAEPVDIERVAAIPMQCAPDRKLRLCVAAEA